jgi:hypothetical protein
MKLLSTILITGLVSLSGCETCPAQETYQAPQYVQSDIMDQHTYDLLKKAAVKCDFPTFCIYFKTICESDNVADWALKKAYEKLRAEDRLEKMR